MDNKLCLQRYVLTAGNVHSRLVAVPEVSVAHRESKDPCGLEMTVFSTPLRYTFYELLCSKSGAAFVVA